MARLPARFSLKIMKGFNVEALIGEGITHECGHTKIPRRRRGIF